MRSVIAEVLYVRNVRILDQPFLLEPIWNPPPKNPGYALVSNTLKPLTNTQTVRGRPTPNDDNVCAFRKGSFCELVGNISNVAIKLLQVLKRSKYVRTMTSSRRRTLTNLTRNFDAGEIFDNQHNGTEDNKKNKNAVMLDDREPA